MGTTGRRWSRSGRHVLVAMVIAATGSLATSAIGHAGVPPEGDPSTFAFSPSLAIDAAKVRLARYVGANPPDVADATSPACPVASVDVMGTAASTVGLDLQLDPWSAVTTSEPELRPDSAPAGQVAGLPVVTCTTVRPADGAVTRPSMFTVTLRDGVSFSDVARRYGVEPSLPVPSGDVGGQLAGSCLDADATGVCVVLWQSRGLVVGMTLDGPAATVGPASAPRMLTTAVPPLLDDLAVVLGAPVECSAAAIAADTGIQLLEEPRCAAGWALGTTAPCPTDTECPPPEAFHVDAGAWRPDGPVDATCAEHLVPLGMTGTTATRLTPACDPDDRSLRGGSMERGSSGRRVVGLQVALNALGYELPIDGTYGPLTTAAVVDHQAREGLTVDGRTGPQTQTSLGI